MSVQFVFCMFNALAVSLLIIVCSYFILCVPIACLQIHLSLQNLSLQIILTNEKIYIVKMASKARDIIAVDKQLANSKLTPSSSKISNGKLLLNKSKSNQAEALKISKYIIEKVLMPKVFAKVAPKKKKIIPKPPPEPIEPPKPTAAEARKIAAKPPVQKPMKRLGIKKKPVVEKEPTHKDQFTTTDDLNQVDAKPKTKKRIVKAKPKSTPETTKKDSENQLETIGDSNIEEISDQSVVMAAADIQGGGDGDLIISEITVKFCRRN